MRYNAGDGGCTTIREPHIMARGRDVERCIGISYHAAVVFEPMTPPTGGRHISSHRYDDIFIFGMLSLYFLFVCFPRRPYWDFATRPALAYIQGCSRMEFSSQPNFRIYILKL